MIDSKLFLYNVYTFIAVRNNDCNSHNQYKHKNDRHCDNTTNGQRSTDVWAATVTRTSYPHIPKTLDVVHFVFHAWYMLGLAYYRSRY